MARPPHGGGTFIANTIPVIGVVLVVSVGFLVARRWREPLFLISALVLEFVVFLTANMLIDRDRPNVPRLDSTPATASYPSGHIAATIVVWGGLAIIVMACTPPTGGSLHRVPGGGGSRGPRRLRGVYRGMHHVTDVMAGALLGVCALAVALTVVRVTGYVSDRQQERRDKPRRRVPLGLASTGLRSGAVITEREGVPEPEPEAEPDVGEPIFVEPRWPIALALSLYIAITVVLRVAEPEREALGPEWLVPGIEIVLARARSPPTRRSWPAGSGGCVPSRSR